MDLMRSYVRSNAYKDLIRGELEDVGLISGRLACVEVVGEKKPARHRASHMLYQCESGAYAQITKVSHVQSSTY